MKKSHLVLELFFLSLIIIGYGCEKENIVKIKNKHEVYIYPNPCDSICSVTFTLNSGENGKMILSDNNKGASAIFDTTLSAGFHNIVIDMSDKKSGIYLLELQMGNSVDRLEILKN